MIRVDKWTDVVYMTTLHTMLVANAESSGPYASTIFNVQKQTWQEDCLLNSENHNTTGMTPQTYVKRFTK